MTIRLHTGDLPADVSFGAAVAIDTETLGLDVRRDRLCVVQLSGGDGSAEIVQIAQGPDPGAQSREAAGRPEASSSSSISAASTWLSLCQTFGVMPAPVYCTKIASKIARTYTDRHGLKDLVRELLGVDLSKQQQSSDWGAPSLSEAQLAYAASDVLHLHALRERLDAMLARENRTSLADAAFGYLPDRVRLDLAGFAEMDIFSHGRSLRRANRAPAGARHNFALRLFHS